MKKSKKIGNTSIRVLETLKFLSNNEASIQDIIRYFEKIDPNNRIYTNEVILKYINTLKVFGFRFIKKKDKYVIMNSPNQIDFSQDELQAISILNSLAENFPEIKIKTNLHNFLLDLEKRFSDNTRLIQQNIKRDEIISFKFDYSKYKKQIEEYEKYCIDGQRIKVTYKNNKDETISCMVEPNEIKYHGSNVYLCVYNPVSAQIQDLKFDDIMQIEQLPQKINSINMLSSVTFLLKGRLAKAYKLHDGEKLMQIKTDGNVVVLNKNEDRTLLLKRLMRYGENCEILSPKNFREEMLNTIKKCLKNYEL